MGCIVSAVACCFCSSAANLCCACMPSCRNSTSSRVMFSLILILTTVLSAIALIPEVRHKLAQIPALCTPFKLGPAITEVKSVLDCDAITGFGAVYRLCFATVLFYLFFAILMIRVRSSADWRSKVQNGFWFFKFLLWFLLVIAAFFIPVEGFTQTWMVIGMIGAVIYIFIQLILLIDFAHSWNEKWIEGHQNSDNCWYACGLVSFTMGFYVCSVVGIGLMYYYYAGSPQCGLNITMLTINLVLCIVLSIMSVLPQIREHLEFSGLLQSSLVTSYVVFLTWSSFSNGLDPACNPSLNTTASGNSTQPSNVFNLSPGWHVAFGIFFLIFSVLYSAFRTSSHTSAGKLTISGLEKVYIDTSTGPTGPTDSNRQTVWDDESDGVTYVYSLFHAILILATLYVMMMLTNWLRPENDLKSIVGNAASYWVRIATSWVCQLLYGATMCLPMLFPDRFEV